MGTPNINILYLLHSFNARAGTEEHAKTLLRSLSSVFNIFVSYPEGGQLILRLPDGQEVSNLGCSPAWPVVLDESKQFDQSFDKALAISNPDIIHIHHLNNWPLHTIERLACLKPKKIMTFHDYFALTPLVSGGPSEDLLRNSSAMLTEQYSTQTFGSDISEYLRKRRSVIERLVTALDVRVAPSSFAAEIIGGAFQCPVKVVEHGIETFITPIKANEPPLRFGFIGSLIPQKGWPMLVEAFLKLREKFSDIELHVFGGDASRILQVPGLNFYGVYDRRMLPLILAQFHVGVVPSIFAETFCLTLSELWMAKTPVIASKIGAIRDRINNNIDGLFFDPGDVSDLTSKMAWFCTHDEWRSWEFPIPRLATSMTADYIDLYTDLLSSVG